MTLDTLKAYRYHIRHPTEQGFEDMTEIRHFVNTIPDEYIRKMISAYYLAGLTWREISTAFYPNSEDNCRKMVQRYLRQIGIE